MFQTTSPLPLLLCLVALPVPPHPSAHTPSAAAFAAAAGPSPSGAARPGRGARHGAAAPRRRPPAARRGAAAGAAAAAPGAAPPPGRRGRQHPGPMATDWSQDITSCGRLIPTKIAEKQPVFDVLNKLSCFHSNAIVAIGLGNQFVSFCSLNWQPPSGINYVQTKCIIIIQNDLNMFEHV